MGAVDTMEVFFEKLNAGAKVPRSLAKLASRMSDDGVVRENVLWPPTVTAPLCVMLPDEVIVRLLPTPSVPRLVAPAFVVSEAPATVPLAFSVWPLAVSVVLPVVARTAVVARVLVNCVVARLVFPSLVVSCSARRVLDPCSAVCATVQCSHFE